MLLLAVYSVNEKNMFVFFPKFVPIVFTKKDFETNFILRRIFVLMLN